MRNIAPFTFAAIVITITCQLSFAEEIASLPRNDCGVNCVLVLSTLYGIPSNKAYISEVSGLNEFGVSMLGLRRALLKQGFGVTPMKTNFKTLSSQNLPGVAYLDGNHFVVLADWKDDDAVIVDLPSPIKRINRSALEKHWDGRYISVSRELDIVKVDILSNDTVDQVWQARVGLWNSSAKVVPINRVYYESNGTVYPLRWEADAPKIKPNKLATLIISGSESLPEEIFIDTGDKMTITWAASLSKAEVDDVLIDKVSFNEDNLHFEGTLKNRSKTVIEIQEMNTSKSAASIEVNVASRKLAPGSTISFKGISDVPFKEKEWLYLQVIDIDGYMKGSVLLQITKTQSSARTSDDFGSIKFGETIHNFGQTSQFTKLVHEFPYRNVGTETMQILDARSTCGCVATFVGEKVINPGEEGRLRVEMETFGDRGNKQYSVYVRTSDTVHPLIQLTVQASVLAPLTVVPSVVDFGHVPVGSDSTRTVIIQADSSNFLDGKPETSSDRIKADATNSTFPPNSVHLKIRLTGGQEEGQIKESVRVRTKIPKYPVIVIPLAGQFVRR